MSSRRPKWALLSSLHKTLTVGWSEDQGPCQKIVRRAWQVLQRLMGWDRPRDELVSRLQAVISQKATQLIISIGGGGRMGDKIKKKKSLEKLLFNSTPEHLRMNFHWGLIVLFCQQSFFSWQKHVDNQIPQSQKKVMKRVETFIKN